MWEKERRQRKGMGKACSVKKRHAKRGEWKRAVRVQESGAAGRQRVQRAGKV